MVKKTATADAPDTASIPTPARNLFALPDSPVPDLFAPTGTVRERLAVAHKTRREKRAALSGAPPASGAVAGGDTAVAEETVGAPSTEGDEKQRSQKAKVHAQNVKRGLSHQEGLRDPEEDERTIFVGNLPNSVTAREVIKLLHHCGKVVTARVRCQRLLQEADKKRGRAIRVLRKELAEGEDASACAYVVFESPSGAEAATALNGTVFRERHLVVGREDPASKAYAPSNSVFVGNLAYDVSDEEIWRFFSDNGLPVERVRVPRDRETGSGKGFAYVAFKDAAASHQAVDLRGGKIRGREVRISHVQKSKDPRVQQKAMSRRQKRLHLENPPPGEDGDVARQREEPQKKKIRSEIAKSSTEKIAELPWMGVAADPRKKIPRDLRWLALHPNERKKRALDARKKMSNGGGAQGQRPHSSK